MTKSRYFYGLDSLRFFAAYIVVFVHTEQLKTYYQMQDFHHPIGKIATLAVSFFFVLSGFLITYLLISEKSVKNNISIKNFYLKRALRIWPLYYILVFIGLVIAPHLNFLNNIFVDREIFDANFTTISLLLLLILPNVAKNFYAVPGLNGHLWSIGVEEQFYLIWPWIVKVNKSTLKYILISIIILLPIIRNLQFIFSYFHLGPLNSFAAHVSQYFTLATFDYMATGGFFAILYFEKNKVLKYMRSGILKHVLSFLIVGLLIIRVKVPIINYDYFAYLFGFLIIMNAVQNDENSFLENKVLKYLGKISYGIYMYHPVAIMLIIFLFKNYIHINSGLLFLIVIQLLSIGLTIVFASISFKYIEFPLLRLKNRLT